MKNKEAFLKELQSRLAVLQESERRDILDEYAQHIDLRMAGGLTEEEAIRDFGDMDQLTAEILEAYHVDPEFGKSARKAVPDPRPALKKGASEAGSWFKRQGTRLKASFTRVGGRFSAAFHRWSAWLRGLFHREKKEVDPETAAAREEERQMERSERQEKRSELRQRAGVSVRKAGGGLGRACLWLVRLAWNVCLLLCALPFGALALLALVGLGFLLVLLTQGYPLIGSASLVCLGTIAACVGLLGLGSELIWHKGPRPALAEGPETVEKPAEEEGVNDAE